MSTFSLLRLNKAPRGLRATGPLSCRDAFGAAKRHDRPAQACSSLPLSLAPSEPRAQLRLRSLGWGLLAGLFAGGLALVAAQVLASGPGSTIEPALRSAGCGFFYGLLAFHLQRVDPDDGHLQAGLVGAVCGIRSLAAPLAIPNLDHDLPAVMMGLLDLLQGWLPLWLPLIGSALMLHGARSLLPALRP